MTVLMRYKSAALVAVMAVSGSLSAFSMPALPSLETAQAEMIKLVPSNKTMSIIAVIAVLATWVRLNSKGSKWDYTIDDWREDFKAFLNSYNIFDAESRATLLRLFDKWIVGRQFKFIDVTYRTKDEDGRVVTTKDKIIKSTAFGAMGMFDAFVLIQIDKINGFVKNIQGINALVNDPMTLLNKDLVALAKDPK